MTQIKLTGILFLGLCGLFSTARAQDSSANIYTLQQCIDIAIKNNADVKTSEFQKDNNKVTLQQAKGNMLPYLNTTISHGLNQGRSLNPVTNGYISQNYNQGNYNLNAGITVWNASSITNSVKQNALNYQASEMDLQQVKDNTTINVILAYLTVLNNQELLNMSIRQAAVSRAQVNRLEIQNKEGSIAPGDLYNMKGQLGTNELTVIDNRNQLRSSQLALTQLMNIPFTENIRLSPISIDSIGTLYDGTVEQVVQQATQNLPMIKAADLREKGAVKGLKAARGGLFPTLSLNGNLGTTYSSATTANGPLLSAIDKQTGDYVMVNNNKAPVFTTDKTYEQHKIAYGEQWTNNFFSSIGLSLKIPILNGLQNRVRVNQAKITERQTSFQAKTVKIQLRQNVEQAYVNMQAAFDRLQGLIQQVKDYDEAFRTAQVKFDAGAITSVDYTIAKNYVDQANLNLIAARYNYILRTKILAYYEGKPLF